jgi:UDP-3-O-[3-hydroxymyristoyl] glucosamine N-acyltransferase
MKIGDNIIITEAVVVYDELGHDLLNAGTRATVTGVRRKQLSVKVKGKIYDNIPIACIKQMMESEAA